MIFLEIVLLSIIVLVLIFALSNEFYQQKLGVSCMPTMPFMRRAVIKACPDAQEVNGKILVLGSGWGGNLRELAIKYPDHRVMAYEMSMMPYFFTCLRCAFFKNITCVRQDFFEIGFEGVGLVFAYLSNPHMKKLEDKFLSELDPQATVISSTFFCPNWQPLQVVDVQGFYKTKLYIYKMPHQIKK